MEHYRERLEKVLKRGKHFGLDRILGGAPAACDDVGCGDCTLTTICTGLDDRCEIERIKWLMSEYKPELVLTQREKHFVEFVQEGWLARDKYCGIYHYFDKPTKERATWEVDGCAVVYLDKFGDNLFPFITWEDEEPWSVEELRKLKVEG